MTTRKVIPLCLCLNAMMLGGCFTGVESTPRIDDAAVKRERAAGITAEQTFLSDVKPEPPSQWRPGKVFRVTDNRISRIFTSGASGADSLRGTDLLFIGTSPARSLTGDDATDIRFATRNGRQLSYRLAATDAARLDTMQTLEIPFTIDLSLVENIDKALRGKEYYIRTNAWYGTDGLRQENGLRHILVKVDSVVPGDAYFPALVCFSVSHPELNRRTGNHEHAVFMSVGNSKSATRNFDVLFSFDNPRKAHPEISDDVWELIISSKVREGMSREECRMALGQAPEILRTPSYGGMREVWSYSDGIFLIFEDGYLTRYRL